MALVPIIKAKCKRGHEITMALPPWEFIPVCDCGSNFVSMRWTGYEELSDFLHKLAIQNKDEEAGGER